jgi:hypothetical protein
MTEKYYFESKWFSSLETGEIVLVRAGYRDPGIMYKPEDYQIQIPKNEIHKLIELLDQEGYIKPRLDERLRTEDLKITHRLLDLLDKKLANK